MNLHLILTGQCNLACAYCYQNARPPRGRMSRATARAAVETVLAAGEPPHRVVLSGGEPFLARERVIDVIRLVRDGAARWGTVECVVLSNGTLVSNADLEVLAANGVELQLSFDGPEASQSRRMPGTFSLLDRLVARAFERQPSWAARQLTIQMTLPADTVSGLAESVRYHVERGVSVVSVEPLATHDPGWTAGTRRRLECQVQEIVAHSLAHYEHTGRVPVAFLREGTGGDRQSTADPSPFVCGAASGTNVAVDPAGRAWACPSVVPSLQRLPPLAGEAASALHLGDVRIPDLVRRLRELPRRAGSAPLLRLGEDRRSSRGRCRDCGVASECRVCPVSTAFVPGNRDPHWIPDNQCDFQRVTAEARRGFQARIAGASRLGEMRRRRTLEWIRRAPTSGGPGLSRECRAEA